MNGEIPTQIKNQKIGQLMTSMRHSPFRPEHQDQADQAFPYALRSIASTKTSRTRTRWKDATKGNPLTGFQVREALGAKEKGEELSSSTITVRKVKKGNRKAKAKAVEKDMDVTKEKGAKAKWAKEKMENLPSSREAHLSATFAWR
jgi:hypothetical protein